MSKMKVNRIENTATTAGGLDIDSSGRIFAGGTVATPSTTSADDIVIAGSGNIGLTINSTNSAESSIFFADGTSGSSQYMGQVNYYHNVDALTFASAGSERLRVDSSGNVFIGGTTASNADIALNANGSATFAGTIQSGGNSQSGAANGSALAGEGGLHASSSTTSQAVVRTYTTGNSTPTASIKADGSADFAGSVGIGTTSASGLLAVHQAASSTSNYINITNNQTGASSWSNGMLVGVNASGDALCWQNESSNLLFGTNNSERLQIDSTGAIFLGNSSSTNNIFANTNSAAKMHLSGGGSGSANIDIHGSTHASDAKVITMDTNGVERMRIGSDGSVRMGADPNPSGTVSQTGFKFVVGSGFVWATQGANSYWNTSTDTYLNFRRNGSQAGSIVIGASSVAYNTSSDYRLKENVVDLDGAITRVKQLAPKRFNFIADSTTTVEGFLAHEAQVVVPEAVTGEKDGEDMQGIDQSKLVPLLTAALQEAIAKIETLEQRLTDAGIA